MKPSTCPALRAPTIGHGGVVQFPGDRDFAWSPAVPFADCSEAINQLQILG